MNLHGLTMLVIALGGLAAFLLFQAARRIKRFGWRRALRRSGREQNFDESMVVFYQRLTSLLAQRGIRRDADVTPLEFARSLNLQAALAITHAYNRVRFGGRRLSATELREIDQTLRQLEDVTKNDASLR